MSVGSLHKRCAGAAVGVVYDETGGERGCDMNVSKATWSARVIAELETSDRRAFELAGDLSAAQLNWKPSPDRWSVGQCLQHLLAGNEFYLPAIAAALDGPAPSPVPEITPGWFGRWFMRRFIDPSTDGGTARAPARLAPASKIDPSIVERFVRSNDTMRDLVRRARDYDVNRIRFRNPFVPLLRFTVGTGFEIIWRHQRRHLLQAERVMQTPTFPGHSKPSYAAGS
jgi:hypothetical protein